ncbi:ABC transporter permease [Hoeflea sp.]|uniref:ABC transporter permease n=1 Tax=Hoeflea sp. TaxID=1940281 RepID=UPI003B52E2F7
MTAALPPLARLALSRLVQMGAVLTALVILTFLMVQLIPGDAAMRIAGPDASAEELTRLRIDMGLDRPVWEQFGHYIGGLAQGDFGLSMTTQQPVAELLRDRLPYTLVLAGLALVLVVCFGFSMGLAVAIATREGCRTWLDHGFTSLTGLLGTVPELIAAIALAFVFAVSLRWLPVSGASEPASVVLPVLAIALRPSFNFARVVRTEARHVLRADFMRTARARRLPGWRLWLVHLAPNVATSALTIAGLIFPYLIGGAVIVENVFAWPGLGSEVVRAVVTANLPVVQAIVLLLGVLVVLTNLIVDLLLMLVDPRRRHVS